VTHITPPTEVIRHLLILP